MLLLVVVYLQKGGLIGLDLLDAAAELILEQQGQREEFTKENEEEKVGAPIFK